MVEVKIANNLTSGAQRKIYFLGASKVKRGYRWGYKLGNKNRILSIHAAYMTRIDSDNRHHLTVSYSIKNPQNPPSSLESGFFVA